MTDDLIKRLRNPIAHATPYKANVQAFEAADALEAQAKRIAELETRSGANVLLDTRVEEAELAWRAWFDAHCFRRRVRR